MTIEGDDTRFESIEAAVVFSTSGEPVAQIHRFSHQTGDWLSQFPGDVRVQAEQLIEDGFDMHSVQVVGEFDGELVWTAWRDGGRERCLIVGGHNGGVACAPMDEADESGLRFVTITGDRTGAEAHVLTLHYTIWLWPYLTIETRSATGITVEEQSGQIIDVELSCPECEAD
ncbi:hypothetical protein [Microbacterium sp. NIBRBAC000506063]|uniref:hypothetical protein n=1 Tax=Microbacterium sp. NIBRBAC000506063 TaxID=2734618 RepID=UPI001BB550E7|nr:hypothetical protein [Microbacterium sp. NIBRBAC000506063]QTV79294.1 hypothetical protein KAE78_09710 [Microbacterium sp. NIBRBAC000506063]